MNRSSSRKIMLTLAYLMGAWSFVSAQTHLYEGVRFKLLEFAPNGKIFPVPAGQRAVVDINSDVGLDLRPQLPADADDSKDWIIFEEIGVEMEVTVQGFLDETNGERTVLHVPGYDTLPLGELRSLWHNPMTMPKVRVELDKTKWSVGDRVTLIVRVRKKDVVGDLFSRGFRVEGARTGLHPRIGSGLIFARAINGSEDAERWKANIVAQMNWYNSVRDPGKLGTFSNWLGVGAGVHLASLDQTTDSVEFGVGANIAFWHGLLSVGYGYNLNVGGSDATYKFIGLDLFDVLNRSQ